MPVSKPPVKEGKTTDVDQLRRYQRYRRAIHRGMAEEEAMRMADRCPGRCEKCGKDAVTADSYVCHEHRLEKYRAIAKGHRAEKKHHRTKKCQVCGEVYRGHKLSKNCPKHRNARVEKRKDTGRQRVQRRVSVSQPKTQAKPPVVRAEKKKVEVLPVLDTDAERAKHEALLERARREREAAPVQSRWERESLWEGRG